jgi:hypothetical protein
MQAKSLTALSQIDAEAAAIFAVNGPVAEH